METDNKSVCDVIASGAVGESGASTMLTHSVEAEYSKMIVLRADEDQSLCPNTGVVAILIINGEVVASDTLSPERDSISYEGMPGDKVVAIVHTIPLFNEIMCVRLGDFNFTLSECDLVC